MANHRGVKDSGEYFVINPASRKVTVPHAHKAIGTVGEHNSEQIRFECPQMVDGHDISQCASRFITWINANGDGGNDELQLVQNEQGAEGMVYLSWTIRKPLTIAKGLVQFSVHFEDIDDDGTTLYRWSTATCRDCDILDSVNSDLGSYEAIYVSGETLVISDYTPVRDNSLSLETNGIIPEGTKTITANGTYEVGEFAQVEIAVDAEAPQITVQNNGLIIASEGGVESQVKLSEKHDSDFVASNIKNGIVIFGVTGTYANEAQAGGLIYNNTDVQYLFYYTDFNDGKPIFKDVALGAGKSISISCVKNSIIYCGFLNSRPSGTLVFYDPSGNSEQLLKANDCVAILVKNGGFWAEINNEKGS